MNFKLLLLIVSLPPNPSSLRVRVWRRLRAIGAVALKRTVYLLPDTPDHYEHFQWLAQEIQRAGGEATLLRVEQIENMSSDEIVQLFHEARNAEYRQLGGRYRKLLQTLDRKSAAGHPRVQAELAQLQRNYEKLHELDFFAAPGGDRHAYTTIRGTETKREDRGRSPRPPRAAVGHAAPSPCGPHCLGLAHQAIHRSRRHVRVR